MSFVARCLHVVVVGRAQAPPPWETPPTAEIPPELPPAPPPPPPPPPRVLTDSWGVGRIRTGCSHPPVVVVVAAAAAAAAAVIVVVVVAIVAIRSATSSLKTTRWPWSCCARSERPKPQ